MNEANWWWTIYVEVILLAVSTVGERLVRRLTYSISAFRMRITPKVVKINVNIVCYIMFAVTLFNL